jgi:acyl carrier protein
VICCTDTAISPKIGEFFPECADIERATPESLHIDSFVLIELLLGLESAFDFEFEDEMLDPETFQTMRQARYVEKRFREGEITNKTMQERRHYNLQLVYFIISIT